MTVYVDWESTDHVALFTNSAAHNAFLASMSQIFDLEKSAPLTSMASGPLFRFQLTCKADDQIQSVYTHFTSSATAALTAPVTEVAFYTVPNSNSEEAKVLIEEDEISSTHPVITVGKSWGGAVGWGESMALVCCVFAISTFLHMFWI